MKIVFLIVAAAFLITVFAFWGMDIDTAQLSGNVAFTVNGDEITIRTYEETVSRYLQQYSGQDISEEFRRQVRKQAASDLIDQKILEQTADQLGIHVTKEEMKGHVRANFPSDDVYRRYLMQAPAAWWQMLEESTDREIKISRARWPLLDGVYLSDSEWAKIISDVYWEADLSHLLFKPAAEVSDSDVQAYYETHRHLILEPTKVRTRQILFKLDKDASETQAQKVTDRAQKVLDLAKAGKDFPALAKKYSDAPDAEDGGDMGLYGPGEMVTEVENVAFGLNVGDVTDTFIRTEFGLHILKLEERVPATIKPLTEDLIDELRAQAVVDTHWQMAKSRAERVFETIQKFPGQFSTLAALNSQAPSSKKGGRLGWIPRLVFPSNYERAHLLGEVTAGAVIEREIGRVAFETPIGNVAPSLVRSPFGWHILKVHDRRPISETPPSDTDIAQVRGSYARFLSEETLSLWLEEQRKNAKIEYKIDIES